MAINFSAILLSFISLGNVNVKAEIALAFDVCLDVGHFEVIVYPVNNEVWEPWVLPTDLEKFIEKLEALLSEVVAENFEAH